MFKNKFFKLANWDNYTISVSPSIFTKDLLKTNLNQFWKEIVSTNVSENQHILFLFRLQWTDNQIVTIGNLQRLNNNDKDYIFNYILEEIKDKGEYYLETSIISIIFSYGIRDGKAPDKTISTKVQKHNYQHHKLPITMNPLEYGKLIHKIGNSYVIQVNDKNIAIITQTESQNEIKFYKSGNLVSKWIDTWLSEDTFSRHLGRKEFIFSNNNQLVLKVDKPAKFISMLKQEGEIINKF